MRNSESIRDLSKRYATLLLAVSVLLAGCSSITGPTPHDRGQYRFVIENGYAEAQTVTVTIDTRGGGPVINETRRLTPDERWIVTTLQTSILKNGYTVTVSTDGESSRLESSATSTGATLLVVGEGYTLRCFGSLTCYNETARSGGTHDQ